MVGRLSHLFSFGKNCCKLNLNTYNKINKQTLIQNRLISLTRQNLCKNSSTVHKSDETSEPNLQTSLGNKFKVFRDEDSEVIFDVDEEKQKINLEELSIVEEKLDPYAGLDMRRNV